MQGACAADAYFYRLLFSSKGIKRPQTLQIASVRRSMHSVSEGAFRIWDDNPFIFEMPDKNARRSFLFSKAKVRFPGTGIQNPA